MGKFEEILSYKGRCLSQGIFVVKGLLLFTSNASSAMIVNQEGIVAFNE